MKHKILVLFAHPALEKSRINKYLIAGMEEIKGPAFKALLVALRQDVVGLRQADQQGFPAGPEVDPCATLDSLIRLLLALGATPRDIALELVRDS